MLAVSKSLQILEAWDFSKIRNYLIENETYPLDQIPVVETEYKRFIALIASHPNTRLVMSSAVDDFWHAHVLHTRDYAAMCNALGMEFIHHDPTCSFGERQVLHNEYVETLAVYRGVFGDLNERYWPVYGQVCGGNGCGYMPSMAA